MWYNIYVRKRKGPLSFQTIKTVKKINDYKKERGTKP